MHWYNHWHYENASTRGATNWLKLVIWKLALVSPWDVTKHFISNMYWGSQEAWDAPNTIWLELGGNFSWDLNHKWFLVWARRCNLLGEAAAERAKSQETRATTALPGPPTPRHHPAVRGPTPPRPAGSSHKSKMPKQETKGWVTLHIVVVLV